MVHKVTTRHMSYINSVVVRKSRIFSTIVTSRFSR